MLRLLRVLVGQHSFGFRQLELGGRELLSYLHYRVGRTSGPVVSLPQQRISASHYRIGFRSPPVVKTSAACT